jgi:hypothetical protein
MKALRNELCAFMIWAVDSKFTCRNMNMHRSLPSHLHDVVSVSDGKRSGVSGSIQSIKMYSCAQCAMQEKSVCCRDVPCSAHMEQGPGPSTLSTSPPPYLPGYWGLSLLVALNKDGPGQWSGHLQAAQLRT